MAAASAVQFEEFDLGKISVPCIVCGKYISKGTLDRNGPAFRAYMCDDSCANAYLHQHSNVPVADVEDESYD